MTRHRTRLDDYRERLEAEIARLRTEWTRKRSDLDMIDTEIAAFERSAKSKRARPGTVEAAIMKTLETGIVSAEAIVRAIDANPESTRHALRRLVAAGKLRKDGESYSVAAQAEAAQ
jgi:ribosomal 50S subunit-associated protein YjgA (DUF615 family)